MNFWEKFKDFLYNSIDYIIMLIVIIAVVCIISWRLDILFVNNGANSILTKNIENSKDDKKVVENIDEGQDADANTEEGADKVEESTSDTNEEETSEAPKEGENAKPQEEETSQEEKPAEKAPEEKPAEPAPQASGTVEVNIPAKSLPGEIGKILEQQGLVTSSKDFVNKCVELKLDTKLKSGKFTINKGASLDDIVRTIAKSK